MKKTTALISAFVIATVSAVFTMGDVALAQGAAQSGAQAAQGTGVPTTLFGDSGIITTITNTLLFVVGALAVVMIIWGGIRYATSAGNSSSVTAAKNTVMYALIGLIIAFLAFAAVNWILSAISTGSTGGFTNV